MPSEPALKEVHAELLILLKKFNDICVTNGIKYSLLGGTLLGAIREKGFIPWDNDADVALLRIEYEKFCEVMKSRQVASDISFDNSHRLPRLIFKNTGAFLDIFIFDSISENGICRKIKKATNIFLRALVEDGANIEGAKKRNKYPIWLYWGYYCLQKVGCLLPEGFALRKFHQFNRNCFCGSGRWIFPSNGGVPGLNVLFPAETLGRYEMVRFEDVELMVSYDYHYILTYVFGQEYMTPKKYVEDTESHELMKQYFKAQEAVRDKPC